MSRSSRPTSFSTSTARALRTSSTVSSAPRASTSRSRTASHSLSFRGSGSSRPSSSSTRPSGGSGTGPSPATFTTRRPPRSNTWSGSPLASTSNFAKKGLAFCSKERERVYGGRRRGSGARTPLSPGNCANPGLASVRGLDWLGPVQRREGSVHVHQTHRHAARHTERRSPARGPLPHTSADAEGRRGAKGREQADLLRLHEGGQAEGRRSDLATRRGIGGRLRAQAHGRWGEGDRRGRKPGA